MLQERIKPAPTADTDMTFRAFSNERARAQNAIEGLHSEQLFAVNLRFVDNLFKACKRSAKKEPFIDGLTGPDMSRRNKRKSHVNGLLQAYIAQELGEEEVEKFRSEVGEDTSTILLSRVNDFLPDIQAQRDAEISPNIVKPNEKLLRLFESDAKQVLPKLRMDEFDSSESDQNIVRRHISALTDAFYAIQLGDREGKKWLERQHGERSDFLLHEVSRSVLPVLDEQLERVHATAEHIEPYDVRLAKKHAQRRGAWLPEDQLEVYSELSGIDPDKKSKRIGLAIGSLAVGAASMFATDGAAGAVAGPIEKEHFHLLETMDGRLLFIFWLATYSALGFSVWKNILAQNRLRRETGASANIGSAAGGSISEFSGAGTETGEKVAGMSQATFEAVKDTAWNIGIVAALVAGAISLRDAGIISSFANIGGTAYELTVAAGINALLTNRRDKFNGDNPFVDEDADSMLPESGTVFVPGEVGGNSNIAIT
jgi:hypothetical protein